MDLDGREVRAQESIAQGHTGVGESAAVNDETIEFRVGQRGDFIDQSALVVRLEKLELRRRGEFSAQGVCEIGEGRAAVDLRLAFAEAVEVGAVENGDAFHAPKPQNP